MRISSIVALAAILVGAGAAHGAVTFSFEAPKVQSTTAKVDIAGTDTFDGGVTASTIGSYSGDYGIVPADVYGGAYGTDYIRTATTFTLTLNQPASYFGLWISGLDAGNSLAFFNGGTQVGSFSYSDVPTAFTHYPSDYAYNPNNGGDYNQAFFFVNFRDTGGTFDKIVFTETGTNNGDFEMDNLTAGVVPEPTTWAMLALGAGLLGAGLRLTRSRRPLIA
jgi:hypothetical protein